MPANSSKYTRAWLLWLFWIAVIGVLYIIMNHLLAPQKPVFQTLEGRGELVVTRSYDGHFYIPGSINSIPLIFIVDTGASIVSVTDDFARQASLPSGQIAQFSTANGLREGQITTAQTLKISGFTLRNVKVATGLSLNSGDGATALLGQNILKFFNLSIKGRQMTLTPNPSAVR